MTRVAVLADRRSWDDLRACFAGLVEIDYTALVGGEPEVLRVSRDFQFVDNSEG